MSVAVNFKNPERLRDFAAVALSDGRKNMSRELKVIAREYDKLIEQCKDQMTLIEELKANARQRETV